MMVEPGQETRFAELKRYVGFTAADAGLLRGFRGAAEPHFERIAQEFYDRIRRHEEAHAVFTGEAQIARLQRSLVRWLERVFSGTYDEAYFAETTAIGRVHVKVGLPQRYMFTAMALIRSSLMQLAGADGAVCGAICRLLDLELAIMLESYSDDWISRIQHVERMEKEALGRSLAVTQHRYVNAVELAHVLIVGLDGDGVIKLFNREAERVTGFARDQVLGAAFITALGFDDGDAARLRGVLARFAALARDQLVDPQASTNEACSAPLETAIAARSGRTRIIRWHLTHAPCEGDEVSVFALGLDTTDERALLARTQQQERLAAIGTLAAGLAHEIRNPLNGAQLHITYLDRALRKDHAQRELLAAVGVVGDELKRLGGLVVEFLDFARPRPLQLRPLAVQSLFERTVQLVAAAAATHGVTVTVDAPTAALEILADAAKLQQVVLNLAQNAIEALAGSGGAVVLRARRQPRMVAIEVEDGGPGIPAGTPVFDAFYSTKPQGTGLGLSITHRIVTDHGGSIDVDSRPGSTVFRVMLPVEGPQGPRAPLYEG